jgi:nucleoside-diphosphate-sugar epimerase
MSDIHLVVGAGTVGSLLALQLAESGQRVVLATRSGSGPEHPLITRVTADATSADSLVAAAPEARAVYNCANPSHYDKWSTEWPPMANAINSYAERTGAVLVTCSNLYAYGPHDGPLTEGLPLLADWPNGRTRAQMWLATKALHDAGRIRATEVRASDYVCRGPQSPVGDRVVPRVNAGKAVQVLGAADQPHSWTAPADVARLMAVVATDDQALGRAWHVPSNPPRTQREIVGDIAAALGVAPPKVSSIPGPIVRVLSFVNPVIREVVRAGYQFQAPFVIDDSAARSTFGLEPTPWGDVIGDLVRSYETQR